MKIKDLITKLSKYDPELEVWMSMYCETGDGYLDGEYMARLDEIQTYKGDPYNKLILLYGDEPSSNEIWSKMCHEISK